MWVPEITQTPYELHRERRCAFKSEFCASGDRTNAGFIIFSIKMSWIFFNIILMLLFRLFGSGGSDAKLRSLLPSGDIWSMMKSEAENIMKAGLED
jgi:hypothetical protein